MAKDPIPSLAWPAATKPSLVLALLETAVVFLMLAAPLLLAGSGTLSVLGPLGVGLIYMIWATVGGFRQASAALPSKFRIVVFLLVQLISGALAAAGFGLLVSAVWLQSAYRQKIIDPSDFAFAFPPDHSTLVLLAPVAILAGAAAFLLAVPLLRRDGDTPGQCFAQIRAQGIGALWPAAAAWILLGLAAVSLVNAAVSVGSLHRLMWVIHPSGEVDSGLLAAQFKGFAAALFASAILIVAFRRAQVPALGSLRGAREAAPARAPAVLAVLGSTGVACAWYLYVMHLGLIMTLGANSMIVGWGEVSRATNAWIDTQQAAGRDPADIASDLRKHGNQASGGSGSGLFALLPELGENLTDMSLRAGCTVTIDAGVADNSTIPADSWLEGYVAAYRPLPDVSYCIRLACPSPAVWQEHTVVVLHSSHPSRSRYWGYNVFVDRLGAGAALEPGGYCTETGELADGYQG